MSVCITTTSVTLDFPNLRVSPSTLSTTPTCTCAFAPDTAIILNVAMSIPQNNPDKVTFAYTAQSTARPNIDIGAVTVTLPTFDVVATTGIDVSSPDTNIIVVDMPNVDPGDGTHVPLGSRLIFDLGKSTVSVDLDTVPDPTSRGPIGCTNFQTSISLPPIPVTPLVNHNYCTDPIITISAQLSGTSGDVLEAVFLVQDTHFYRQISSNNCYQGCTSPIDNGTRIVVYSLFVNCVVRGPLGSGTLLQKFPDTVEGNELYISVIGYSLTKLILGRLVTGEFNIKWLYQCHYNELRNKVFHSQYKDFVRALDMFFDLNQYFFCCD